PDSDRSEPQPPGAPALTLNARSNKAGAWWCSGLSVTMTTSCLLKLCNTSGTSLDLSAVLKTACDLTAFIKLCCRVIVGCMSI
ncbi:hypothetical protein AMECASPLE_029695, partial [Ameca splendens]